MSEDRVRRRRKRPAEEPKDQPDKTADDVLEEGDVYVAGPDASLRLLAKALVATARQMLEEEEREAQGK